MTLCHILPERRVGKYGYLISWSFWRNRTCLLEVIENIYVGEFVYQFQSGSLYIIWGIWDNHDWDVELAWHSLRATRRICSYSLEHGLGIHVLRPTWSCLIVDHLAFKTFLYWDQLRFYLSYHKSFWLPPRHYGPIRTHKA